MLIWSNCLVLFFLFSFYQVFVFTDAWRQSLHFVHNKKDLKQRMSFACMLRNLRNFQIFLFFFASAYFVCCVSNCTTVLLFSFFGFFFSKIYRQTSSKGNACDSSNGMCSFVVSFVCVTWIATQYMNCFLFSFVVYFRHSLHFWQQVQVVSPQLQDLVYGVLLL